MLAVAALVAWSMPAWTTAVAPGDGPAPAGVHLVIAPERYREALRPYLAHRTEHSPHLASCRFVTLERILATSEGSDDPEKLKRFLFQAWKDEHLTSCLLVGDCDTLPMRSMVLDRGTPQADNWAFYPCDLYYADLAKADGSFDDWNAGKDGFHAGYIGEVHGETLKDGPINFDRIDYKPEIAIGRWPVSTPEACAAVAAKTIAYETTAPGDGKPLAVFFGVGGWVDVRDRVRGMAKELEPRCATSCYLHDSKEEPAPDEAHMREALAKGPRFVFHTGHGEPWSYVGCLSLHTLEGVAQPAKLPVCFSVGCSTAEVMTQAPYQPYVDVDGVEHRGTNNGEVFTSPPPPPAPYQSGPRNSSSIAEELVRRANGGAVAVIGCDTGAQPCAVTLLDGFVESLAQSSGPTTVGELWRRSLVRYYDAEHLADLAPTPDWYPPSIFFQGMKFVLLGDPALRVME